MRKFVITTVTSALVVVAIFLESFSHSRHQPIEFLLTLNNNEPYPVTVTIHKGDLYETLSRAHKHQNLVIAERIEIQLDAYQTRTITLLGFCTNQKKRVPSGEAVRPTPMYMDYDFETQEDGWRYLQSLRRE